MIECSVCHSKIASPGSKTVSRAYDTHRSYVSSKTRLLNVLLVSGDCILVGFQPILVYMSKVDGGFKFSPLSVNFLTEVAKVIFAIIMLLFQARNKKVGEKSLLSISSLVQAARNNVLLAVPALLYAINNYLKFIMQLYFNPATVKMLSNLKVLVIAILLKMIMKRRFSIIQWEALALLLIGISINQLRSLPEGTTSIGVPVATGAYMYTLIFVTVPSMASVFNEYALKSQFETSIYHQNLFLYGYGAIFNFLAILGTALFKGPSSLDILQGHSKATMLLICNNAAQGILSSFFFKYAEDYAKGGKSIVFTQTKRDADYVSIALTNSIASKALHGDISQHQRERTLNGFRQGKFTVLVATDVASRGLDIPNVDLVIHYELPNNAETFVHRSGRTGRAGKEGSAILMYTNSQRRTVKTLERDVGCKFEFISSPAIEDSSRSHVNHKQSSAMHDDGPSSDYYGKFSSRGGYPRENNKSPRSLRVSRGWSNGRDSNNEVRGGRNSWGQTSKSSRDDWIIGDSSRSDKSLSRDRGFGGSCFNCGRRGHMSSDCPDK